MTIQPIEVEARAYLEAYRDKDGKPGNYRTDLIAGLLDSLDARDAEIVRLTELVASVTLRANIEIARLS